MKKLVSVLLLVVCAIVLPTQALAANVIKDGERVSGTLYEDDGGRSYTFDLQQAQRVNIKVESEVKKFVVTLRELRQGIVFKQTLNQGREGNPEIQLFERDLPKGEYIIEVAAGRYDYEGKFAVTYTTGAIDDGKEIIPLAIGEQIEGFIPWRSEGDLYRFTLQDAGFVNVILEGLLKEETTFDILDSEYKTLLTRSKRSSTTSPALFNERVALKPGEYYLQVRSRLSYLDNTGAYKLTTGFERSKNNEIEPNDSFDQAQRVSFGQQITGYLGLNDVTDYFTFTVPANGRVDIALTSRLPQMTFARIYNAQNHRLVEEKRKGDATNPAVFEKLSLDLAPGKYYLNIETPKLIPEGGEYTFTILGFGITQFTDYVVDAYWVNPFVWGMENAIIQGDAKTNRLNPYQNITEAQWLAMLMRHALPGQAQDAPGHEWYRNYYTLAQQNGIAVRNTPYAPLRRGDVATMLARVYLGYNISEQDAVRWLYDNGITTGVNANGPQDYNNFNPNGYMARAHAVTFMHRLYEKGITPKL